MILYLDTSALLKKYFKEKGSGNVISLWKKTTAIVISTVAYAETLPSIHRKKREASPVDERVFKSVITSFQRDWKSFIHVDVNNDLNETIERLVFAHPLKGFDAVHLASALIVHKRIQESFVFVYYDKILRKAAKEEGLDTFPEDIG